MFILITTGISILKLFLFKGKGGSKCGLIKHKQSALMYMLRGFVKESFLEVCLEQDFKRRYRYVRVKKKWSEKKGSKTKIVHWGAISEEGGMDAKKKQQQHVHCRMVKQALGWNLQEYWGAVTGKVIEMKVHSLATHILPG